MSFNKNEHAYKPEFTLKVAKSHSVKERVEEVENIRICIGIKIRTIVKEVGKKRRRKQLKI